MEVPDRFKDFVGAWILISLLKSRPDVRIFQQSSIPFLFKEVLLEMKIDDFWEGYEVKEDIHFKKDLL